MPALDTEVLFAVNPEDDKHVRAVNLLRSKKDLVVPDTSFFEFQMVLRTMGNSAAEVGKAVLAVRSVLSEHGVKEVGTMNSSLIALQCELESSYDLDFFDSLIAASALSLDSVVVSDDTAFDEVPGLRRVPLS